MAPADREVDTLSIPHELAAFERQDVQLTAAPTVEALDADGNGLPDRLRIGLQIDSMSALTGRLSLELIDSGGEVLQISDLDVTLSGGIDLLEVYFDGSAISAGVGEISLSSIEFVTSSEVISLAGQTPLPSAPQAQLFDSAPPPPPVAVYAIGLPDSVRVSWSIASGSAPTGFRVYRGISPGEYQAVHEAGLGTVFVIPVDDDQLLHISVTAFGASGVESDYSAEVTAARSNAAPEVPGLPGWGIALLSALIAFWGAWARRRVRT